MDNAEMPDMLLKYFDMTSPVHGDIYGDYEIGLHFQREQTRRSGSQAFATSGRLLSSWPEDKVR